MGYTNRAQGSSRIARANTRLADFLQELLEARVIRHGRHGYIAAVSSGLASSIQSIYGITETECGAIPNGVDLNRCAETDRVETRAKLGIPDSVLVAVFVGGDWARKGLSIVIEAIVAAGPSWALLVVGSGPQDEYVQAKDCTANVHFVGQQANVHVFLEAADVYITASAYEAFSLALLEAASAGLPLLATRTHGAAEFIADGKNGFLVERSALAIASRLQRLEKDCMLRLEMGAAARQSAVEALTWPQNTVRTLSALGVDFQ